MVSITTGEHWFWYRILWKTSAPNWLDRYQGRWFFVVSANFCWYVQFTGRQVCQGKVCSKKLTKKSSFCANEIDFSFNCFFSRLKELFFLTFTGRNNYVFFLQFAIIRVSIVNCHEMRNVFKININKKCLTFSFSDTYIQRWIHWFWCRLVFAPFWSVHWWTFTCVTW